MPESSIVAAIVFLAVFTQSLTGFGSALVAMAILPAVIALNTATPLVALVMVTIEVVLLVKYRKSVNIKAVLALVLGSLPGIPLGLFLTTRVDETVVLTTLGFVVSGYALYSLIADRRGGIRRLRIRNPSLAYPFGFVAGVLGGAYNITGPPVVVYADCSDWPAEEFKGNLQGFFVVTSLAIVIGHAWKGNIGSVVGHYYAVSLPAMALGIVAGTSADQILKPVVFRKVVLALLVVMGLRLIVSA
ncbi:sulfite exporter TauE/SafE family protein [Gemmatimonadota bacterium]